MNQQIKVTFDRVDEFQEVCLNYLRRTKKKNHIHIAIDVVIPSIKKAWNKKISNISKLRPTFAATDKDGYLILNEGKNGDDRFTFTPEQLNKFKDAVERMGTEEVKITKYIASHVPKDLTFEEVEAFRGIIIPDDYKFIPLAIEDDESEEAVPSTDPAKKKAKVK